MNIGSQPGIREVLSFATTGSPIGELHLAASSHGLRMIEFGGREFPPRNVKAEWQESNAELRPYREQLLEYFAGTRRQFAFALDLRGTPFQLRCWSELQKIPYGRTCSYAELAGAVGCGKGFRAVGQANHRNPLPIVVPCHRVLTSAGTLGGYGGGLHIKRTLLELEGATFRETA